MISVAEAQERVLAMVMPLVAETVGLRHARGRVLAADASAFRDQPPFDASAMDGYALRAQESGDTLIICGEAGAGHALGHALLPGQAARIFTGAPVPEGADAVVMQENVHREGDRITLSKPVTIGENIRLRGSDFAVGQTLPAPRRLGAAEIGLLAAMNIPDVSVSRRPIVAILATGDELVQPGEAPREDQIIASGGLAIAALLEAEGAEARILPIARDDLASLRFALSLAEGADMILTIGGASVGDHDLMGRSATELGLELDFHKVALRPGKPLLCGWLQQSEQRLPLLGLPGNPVSAMVCAILFALPAIRRMQGLNDVLPRRNQAVLAVPLGPNGDRMHYMRAKLQPGAAMPSITPVASQDSAKLWLLAEASALLIRESGEAARDAGETVPYLAL